jgi:hypothetical protein
LRSLRDTIRQLTASPHQALGRMPLMRAVDGAGQSTPQYRDDLTLQF